MRIRETNKLQMLIRPQFSVQVKLEVGGSAIKTLHRNLQLPLCALPIVKKPVPRTKRSITPVKLVTPDSSESDGSDNEASSEGESILVTKKSQ